MTTVPKDSEDLLEREISQVLSQLNNPSPPVDQLKDLNWLVQSGSLLRPLIDLIPSACLVFSVDRQGIPEACLEINRAACLLLGSSREEAVGAPLDQLVDGSRLLLSSPLAEQGDQVFPTRLLGRDGNRLPVELHCRGLSLGQGRRLALFWVDNVQRAKTPPPEHLLAMQAFDELPDPLAVLDERGVIQKCNPAFADISGHTTSEAVGRTIQASSPHGRQDGFYQHIMSSAGATGAWQGAVLHRHRREGARFLWLSVREMSRCREQSQRRFLTSLREIENGTLNHDKIAHLALHDPLTGLPNRILFQDRLRMALSQARRHVAKLGLVFLDLDNFKTINDSLGHSVGDQVLKGVAARLVSTMRQEDTVARLGGDEFVVILPAVADNEEVLVAARRIMQRLDAPLLYDRHELNVGASMGITIFPEDGEDPETLLKNADMAMYRAKEQGRRNFQLYNPSMHTHVTRRLVLENNLRQALAKNEFEVHYQPKVDIQKGQVVGMEALLRWQRQELGIVGPQEFIPLAEESGLIVPLGEWVLHQACLAAQKARQAGYQDLTVSVNLSTRQLLWQHDLVEMVQSTLEETGLPARALELELTESSLMQNVEAAINTMSRVHELGVSISLDDFGTGYSSLQYLKRFPIDVLKIDRSFVREIPANSDDVAIVISIISMAQALKLKVVAEGVEYHAQMDFLRRLGCDSIQGFLSSPALPFEELMEFLNNRDTMLAFLWGMA